MCVLICVCVCFNLHISWGVLTFSHQAFSSLTVIVLEFIAEGGESVQKWCIDGCGGCFKCKENKPFGFSHSQR